VAGGNGDRILENCVLWINCDGGQLRDGELGEPKLAVRPLDDGGRTAVRRRNLNLAQDDSVGSDDADLVDTEFGKPQVAVRSHRDAMWFAARCPERELGDDASGADAAD